MKAHYINILLFALPLNILVILYHEHNQRNHNSTTLHTPITRLLCECELYEPSNYDNDPQMKKVMENFNRQTSQRFHEYDNRMVEKRQKCKDKCDKEIQKIILKDKLEKELMDKLAALETDIQNDAIPTCVCEKSLVDKTEKFCLNCGKNMGAIAPWWGLVCGVGYAGWLHAATAAAIELATKKGIEEGVKVVIAKITNSLFGMLPNVQWSNFINGSNYNSIPGLVKVVTNAMNSSGKTCINSNSDPMCIALPNLKTTVVQYVTAAEGAAAAKTESVKAIEVGKVTTQSTQLYTGIGYCVLAILIIILIMVITYLILRHRRKKKMKKKLQYIKLLEE